MPPAIDEQVESRIAEVEQAANKALFALKKKTGLFGGMTTEAEASTSAVRALRSGSIAPWARRGRDAAKKNGHPAGGWDGWIKAGNVYLESLPELEELAERGRLDNIEATVEATLKDTATLPARALKATGKAVGETADELVSPIFGKLVIVALVLGAGAYGYYRFMR